MQVSTRQGYVRGPTAKQLQAGEGRLEAIICPQQRNCSLQHMAMNIWRAGKICHVYVFLTFLQGKEVENHIQLSSVTPTHLYFAIWACIIFKQPSKSNGKYSDMNKMKETYIINILCSSVSHVTYFFLFEYLIRYMNAKFSSYVWANASMWHPKPHDVNGVIHAFWFREMSGHAAGS